MRFSRAAGLVAGAALLASAPPGRAQVFHLQGGSSTLFEAHGASCEIHAQRFDGWVGAGYLDGVRFGGFVSTTVKKFRLGVGDDNIPFRLPTDVFNTSYYFVARGVLVGQSRERVRWFGFTGATSTSFAAPYFRGARADNGVGVFFLDFDASPKLHFFTRNVVSGRQTSISGLEWVPRSDLRVAVAGGAGANRGYYASSLAFERNWVTVKSSFGRADEAFRRVVVENPLSAEVDRENLLVLLRPRPYFTVSAARQNFLQPRTRDIAASRGAVNQYFASVAAGGFNVGAALFQSFVGDRHTVGTSLTAGKNLFNRVQVNFNWLKSRPSVGESLTSLIGTFRETFSPRWSLSQVVSHSEGNTSVAFGGGYNGNRFSVSVDYQTVYVPFLLDKPFRQALLVSLRWQPFGTTQLQLASHVAPDGRVRYTTSMGAYLYRGLESSGVAAPIVIYKYLVRGHVLDPAGHPVSGAAVRVDGDIAFTNSSGEFLVRKRKAGSYRLVVSLEEFLAPGRYEVVTAPDAVAAEEETKAPDITIVVRRIPPPAE